MANTTALIGLSYYSATNLVESQKFLQSLKDIQALAPATSAPDLQRTRFYTGVESPLIN